jgi:hypothetical protein
MDKAGATGGILVGDLAEAGENEPKGDGPEEAEKETDTKK